MNRRLYALGRLKSGEMNTTEQRYSKHLEGLKTDGNVLWYAFESMTFKLANGTRYTPDFMVMLDNGIIEAHEVKGAKAIFRDDSKVKVKVFAEKFPFPMVVFYPQKDGTWEREEY